MVDSYTVLDARLGENQFSNCIRDPIVVVYVCVCIAFTIKYHKSLIAWQSRKHSRDTHIAR